ncbi:hypothetical protein GSY74_07595, partial [Sulfurovum sp. bin170]|uniref:hypothetical protein n=1 Tax=Sulfurovum sp. bin170 TaxID=2695268 RepID=UPI0013E08A9C
ETYNDYLIYIFEYYHDKKVLFVPHRLEKIDNEIANYIDESDRINLLIPDESIELYFLNNHIYPNEVASFITSALFNIRKLFPDTDTKAFRIDTEFLDKSHRKNIELIYKYYQNEDVRIIEMKDILNEES